MIIRSILVMVSIYLLIWFLKNRSASKIKAGKKMAVVLFFIFAVISLLVPHLTDKIAHEVGVGRGADLLLYLLTMAFITFVLNQYVRSKEEDQRLVKLARKVAILEANQINKQSHKIT